MNIFRKRPLLLALFIFVFCSIVCATLPSPLRLLGAFVCLILFIISLLTTIISAILKFKHKRIFLSLTLCFAFSFSAFLSSTAFFDNKLAHAETLGNESNVLAEIEECTFSASYVTVYTAKIKSIDGQKVNFKASVSSLSAMYFEAGETIVANMTFSPFSITDYGYDERTSNISQGILTSATFEDFEFVDTKDSFNILLLINKLRNYIADTIDQRFDKTAPIIKALLIGEQSDIDAMTKSNFSRLGISHILSISGTHFSVLLGMFAVLLSLLGLNKKGVYALLIPTALLYMALSGFSFSVCRAGIMALMTYWSFLCGRQRDTYTTLFLSVCIILLIAPYAILSISLWLSFTATFTILIVLELLSDRLFNKDTTFFGKIINFVLIHLIITASISFATLPIISLYFGYISVVSPITNLIIVPLFEIFLYIIPFSVTLSAFSFPVAIAEFAGSKLLWLVEELASYDNLLIAVNHRFVLIIACIGIFVTLVLIAVPLRKRIIIGFPSIISVILIAVGLAIFYEDNYDETHVTYFTTRKSDAIVLTDTNRTMCIDVTNGSSAAMYYMQAVVKEHFTAEILSYVFTHYRSDHINSFKKLASRIKIKKVYLPIATEGKSAEYMHSAIAAAKKFNIEIVFYKYGMPFDFEQCEVTVFEPQFLKRTTHEIISLYISTYKDDMLYLGSSFSEGKLDLTSYINQSDYIIFGQHYPKIKEQFKVNSSAELIYGNTEIYEKSDNKLNSIILNDGERYYFMLK